MFEKLRSSIETLYLAAIAFGGAGARHDAGISDHGEPEARLQFDKARMDLLLVIGKLEGEYNDLKERAGEE